MFRSIATIALALALLAGLAGCRQQATPVTPTATASRTPTLAPTFTPTAIPTDTPTLTPLATPTMTPLPTQTPTYPPKPTPTSTPVSLPTPTLTPVPAGVYYVAPGGNDAGLGTLAQPWATIQKAANTMLPGDTVTVLAGDYTERVQIARSGVSGWPLTFQAQGEVTMKGFAVSGSYIILRGFTVTPTGCYDRGFDVSGDYCLIASNTVRDSESEGIILRHTTNNCVVRNNTIAQTVLTGLTINGTNHLIEGNDISDIRDHGPSGACGSPDDANGISFFGSGHIFRGNYIHDLLKTSQSGSPHLDAFQTYSSLAYNVSSAKNTIIERNRVFMGDTSTGQLEEPSTTIPITGFMIGAAAEDWSDGLTIRNNLVESSSGFSIGGPRQYVSNLKIYNNTWRSDISFPVSGIWPQGLSLYGVTAFEIYNNIFVDFSFAHIAIGGGSSGGSYDYNLLWNSDGSTPGLSGYVVQPHDQRGVDPRFVAAFSDLRLQPGSPAIDSGIALAEVTDDYAGNPRPQGAGYDVGAYEFLSRAK